MEMQEAGGTMEACELARKAKEGAEILFKAVWMEEAPAIPMEASPEEAWAVKRMPHLALIILQEWFYNTLREVAAGERAAAHRTITVQVGRKGITIDTPLQLEPQHIRTLQAKAQKLVNLVLGGMGLRLIVNLMWLGYRRRPRVEYSNAESGTRIHLDFPMKRLPRRKAGEVRQ
jgi:hypothetical protein